MERKTSAGYLLKADADQGIVEHIVSVMGVRDLGGDVIHPGAYTKTLAERGGKIRVLDGHNSGSVLNVVGKPISVRELSREELPADLLAKFPEATGALWAKTKFLLNTPEGRGVFDRIKEGAVDEYSIGYDTIVSDDSSAVVDGSPATTRNLRELKLWEYSPVIWGMNQATMTTDVKSKKDGEQEAPPAEPAKDEGEPATEEAKPYGVVHEGNDWLVYKLGEDGKPVGEPLGTHATEEEAQAQVAALYANEADEEEAAKPDDEEEDGKAQPAPEKKVGRVLSRANADRIMSAYRALRDALEAAGIDATETDEADKQVQSTTEQAAGPDVEPPTAKSADALRLELLRLGMQLNKNKK